MKGRGERRRSRSATNVDDVVRKEGEEGGGGGRTADYLRGGTGRAQARELHSR